VKADGTVALTDSYADLEKHYPDDSWSEPGNNAYGCVKQLFKLKKANRHLKTLLSIGGWTLSVNFPAAAATAEGRARFASTAVTLLKDWGLDGLDIDWEYPRNSVEAQNFVLLIDAVRAQLDSYSAQYANGYHFLLTAAMPAGPTNYNNMSLRAMGEKLDFLNLMAYDYAGSFSADTGHQANLYPSTSNPRSTPFSTDKAITDYLAAGVPSRKIVLGLPLYGRAFEGTAGAGQPYTGVGQGSWEAGIWDYKALPQPGGVATFDEEVDASYTWDAAARKFVSYDNVISAERKVSYVKQKNLGGTMFWEASGDRTDDASLITTTFNGQGGSGSLDSTQNLLSYPNSVYDNIKAGLP
jgi:chitinase